MTGMETACTCSYDGDYDPPEFSCVTHPIARKQHKCEECRQPILPGTRYERLTGKWEGGIDTFTRHLGCAALANDWCAPIGYARETIIDEIGYDYVTGEHHCPNCGEWTTEDACPDCAGEGTR